MRNGYALALALLLSGCGTGSSGTGGGNDGVSARLEDAGAAARVQVSLRSGWNALAFQQSTLQNVTGSGVAGAAFYDGTAYQTRNFTVTDLQPLASGRQGVWLFATSATNISYDAVADAQGSRLTLREGWNLAGFPLTSSLAGSALVASENGQSVELGSVLLPTFYFIAADGTYKVVDVTQGGTLPVGQACWVYALRSVTLTWGSPTPSPTPRNTPTPRSSPTPVPGPSPRPSATPRPSPSPQSSPSPVASPQPSASPAASPSPAPLPSPSPAASPSPDAAALYQGCRTNLANMASALTLYATDNSGRLPTGSLNPLVPTYLSSIPTCPAVGSVTYSYQMVSNPDLYTIVCTGSNHSAAGIGPNLPRVTSIGGVQP